MTDEHPIDESKLDKPLGKIIRIATKKDLDNLVEQIKEFDNIAKREELIQEIEKEIEVLNPSSFFIYMAINITTLFINIFYFYSNMTNTMIK